MTRSIVSVAFLSMFVAISAFAADPKPASPPAKGAAPSLKEQLVGSWTLVSSVMELPDGKKEDMLGGDQKGMAMFDAQGRFTWMIMGAARKPFKADNRMEGTLDEYKGAVQGTVAYYGTYSVNEADKSITFNIDRSVFPNWDGTKRTSHATISGDELNLVNTAIPSKAGAQTPKLVWKRAK